MEKPAWFFNPKRGQKSPFFVANLFATGFCLCFALAWLQPFHFPPWVSFLNEAWAGLALVFLLAHMYAEPAKGPIQVLWVPKISLVTAVFAALISFQLMAGQVFFAGEWVAGLVYATMVFLALLAGANASPRAQAVVAQCMAIASLLLVGTVLVQTFLPDLSHLWLVDNPGRMAIMGRAISSLAQPNHAATAMLLGLAALVAIHQQRAVSGAVRWGYALFVVAGLAMVGSRAGYVIALGFFATCMFFSPAANGGWRRFECIVMLAILVATYFGWTHVSMAWFDAVPRSQTQTIVYRTDAWIQLLIALVSDQHWLGFGFLGVGRAQNSVADVRPVPENQAFAHNVVIDLVVWFGVLSVLVLAPIVWFARKLIITAFQQRSRVNAHVVAVLMSMALAIHACLEYPHAYLYFLIPVGFWLGVSCANLPNGYWVLRRPGRLAAGVAGLVLTSVGIVLVADYLKAEQTFRDARFASARIGDRPPTLDGASQWVWTQLEGLYTSWTQVPQPGLSEAQLAREKAVAEAFPWSSSLFKYIVVLAKNGQRQEAVRQMRVFENMYQGLYPVALGEWCMLSRGAHPELLAVLREHRAHCPPPES